MNFPQHTLIKPLNKWQKLKSAPSFKANVELGISEIKNTSEEDILRQFPRIKDFKKTDENGNTILHELSRANYFYAIKALLVNPSRTKEIINIQNNI